MPNEILKHISDDDPEKITKVSQHLNLKRKPRNKSEELITNKDIR